MPNPLRQPTSPTEPSAEPNEYFVLFPIEIIGAEEKTRTSTHLRVHEPESSAYINTLFTIIYYDFIGTCITTYITFAEPFISYNYINAVMIILERL